MKFLIKKNNHNKAKNSHLAKIRESDMKKVKNVNVISQ